MNLESLDLLALAQRVALPGLYPLQSSRSPLERTPSPASSRPAGRRGLAREGPARCPSRRPPGAGGRPGRAKKLSSRPSTVRSKARTDRPSSPHQEHGNAAESVLHGALPLQRRQRIGLAVPAGGPPRRFRGGRWDRRPAPGPSPAASRLRLPVLRNSLRAGRRRPQHPAAGMLRLQSGEPDLLVGDEIEPPPLQRPEDRLARACCHQDPVCSSSSGSSGC